MSEDVHPRPLRQDAIGARLSWSLAATTLLFAVVLAVALAMLDWWRADQANQAEIEKHFALIQMSSVEPLAESLWNYNRAALTLIGQGVLRQKNVSSLVVYESGKAVVNLGSPVPGEITRAFALLHGAENLGHMTVSINPQAMREQAWEHFGHSLLSELFLTLCICTFVLFLIERKLMRYVRQAASFVNHRNSRNLAEVLVFKRRKWLRGEDELDILIAGFTGMQNALAQSIDSLQRDISRRQAVEAELLQSETRLQAIFQGSPIGMAVTRARDRTILEINRHALHTLGFAPHEIIGMKSDELELFSDPLQLQEARRLLLENGSVEGFALDICKKNGASGVVEMYGSAIDIQGEQYIVGMWIDVTDRRRIEQELDQHRNHLEELIQVRTTELERSRQKADSANRAKSTFLANMSHELRTPLTAILGFAKLLLHDAHMAEESRQKAHSISRAGQHLLSLISEILELSRIESGHVQMVNEDFDLGEVLQGVEELIRERTQSKGLEFVVEIAADTPRLVTGDARRLRQVLINLLGNAAKYTERGSVSLRVGQQANALRFEVADTGPGIAVEDQQHIFKTFYQTEAGAAKHDGTGLGLAISREYAQLMGGRLEVRSQLGQGSVFSLYLRLPVQEPSMRLTNAAPAPMELAPDFSVLPGACISALIASAKALDLQGVRLIAAPLRNSHPELVRALEQMLNGFRFDHVVQACEMAAATQRFAAAQ